MKRIKSLKQLIANCRNGAEEFFILLNGNLRSSKSISYDGKGFWVLNQIDESEQDLTKDEIMNDKITNIGKAIKLGAFFKY